MKQFMILLSLSLTVLSCSDNSKIVIGNKTIMTVEPVYDGGKVLIGEEIEAKFKVTNDGDYPLILSEVKGQCTCTVAEYPDDPIPPGESGIIKATVKTETASVGKLSKEVRIIANTEPSLTILEIKATVMRK